MKNKRIPEIRFSGFRRDWEHHNLGELVEDVSGNDGRTELPVLTISAGNGWMNQKDRFSQVIAGKELKNYTLLKKGELSYNHGNSKLAKYGAVFELKDYDEALVPRVYHSFKSNDKSNPTFLDYLFSSKIPDKELGKLVTSGARMDGLLNINKQAFFGIRISVPNVAEQTQIGNFLKQLDDTIALHQQELTTLEQTKQGFLQKMFPKEGESVPEIRFPGFTEDWEQSKLGEFVQDYVEKTSVQNQYPVLTSSQKHGIIYQDEYFADRQVTTQDNIGYFVLPRGYFTFRSRSDNGVFKFNRNDLIDKGIISYFYPVFSIPNGDSDFFLQMLNSTIKKQVALAAEGTGQRVLSLKKFKNINVVIPTIQEQIKIGNYFKQLDKTIDLHQRELESLKETKKAFLHKMFA